MFGIHDISIHLLSDTLFINSLAFILLSLLAVYLYMKTNPPIPKYLKILLGFLRILALTALFIALFEPILSYTRLYNRLPRISVLLDESLSMDKTENDKPRKVRRDSLLSGESFAYLNDNAELTTYFLGGDISTDKNSVNREATAIGDALLTLESEELSRPPDFRILFSDGNSNSGRKSSEIAGKLKTKLYTIDLSMTGKRFDLGITDLNFNPVMFAGQSGEINLKINWENSSNRTIPIQLLDSGKIVSQSSFTINQSEGLGEISLKYHPTKPGQKILRLHIPPIENEENKSNNSRAFSLKVLKSKLSVLIVTENPDYEISFLKRYLTNAEKYDIDLKLIGTKSGNLSGSIPIKQSELNRYDLIILHDVRAEKLIGKQTIFESYLKEKGGSIWLIMGEQFASLGSPEWLNALLPFYPSNSFGIQYLTFNAEPAEGKLYHPVVRLGDSQTEIRKIWSELPPFETLVRCDNINPNANILAYGSGINQNNKNIPILGFMRHGPGKLFVSSAQPFWSFGFINVGFGESDIYYKRFIEGAASWLTVSDDMEPVRIHPEKNVYSRGEIVRFNGYAFDLGYRPIPDVVGYVQLKNINDESYQADLLPKQNGKYTAELFNVKPGIYQYTASLLKDKNLLKEVSGQIEVNRFSLEEYDTGGNPNELKTAAVMSGGKYYTAAEFDKAVQSLDLDVIEVKNKKEIKLWNKIWLLILFIVALSIEWLLRKTNQLI